MPKLLYNLLLIIFSVMGASQVDAATMYDVNIFTPPSGYTLQGYGMNSQGQITGYAYDPNQSLAFVASLSTFQFIGDGAGFAINNTGTVVGVNSTGGFLWDQSNGVTPLAIPNGYTRVQAKAVNNMGQAAGFAVDDINGTQVGVVWTNNVPQIVASLRDVSDINDSGQIVGTDASQNFFTGPFGGSLTPIARPGLTGSGAGMGAAAINNSGVVAGGGYDSNILNQVWYLSGATYTQIPALAGTNNTTLRWPGSMNSQGQLVGFGYQGGIGDPFGFLWSPVDGLVNLSAQVPAGWTIGTTYAINDSGQILADAKFNGQSYVVRLDASGVPEPQTYTLVGIGAALLLNKARRSRPTSASAKDSRQL